MDDEDGDTVAENIAQSLTSIMATSTNDDARKHVFRATNSRFIEEFQSALAARLDAFLRADAKRLAEAQLANRYAPNPLGVGICPLQVVPREFH